MCSEKKGKIGQILWKKGYINQAQRLQERIRRRSAILRAPNDSEGYSARLYKLGKAKRAASFLAHSPLTISFLLLEG